MCSCFRNLCLWMSNNSNSNSKNSIINLDNISKQSHGQVCNAKQLHFWLQENYRHLQVQSNNTKPFSSNSSNNSHYTFKKVLDRARLLLQQGASLWLTLCHQAAQQNYIHNHCLLLRQRMLVIILIIKISAMPSVNRTHYGYRIHQATKKLLLQFQFN